MSKSRIHPDYDRGYQEWLEREHRIEQGDYNEGQGWDFNRCPDCEAERFDRQALQCFCCGRAYDFNPIDGFQERKIKSTG